MSGSGEQGLIVVLNGVPRAGKSSIVSVIQDSFEGVWMNIGVDVFARGATPPRYQPGVGLRPGRGPTRGGERPDLEPLLPALHAAMYDSIAAHSRAGLNVVVDGALHGALHAAIPADCARRLAGLPAWFVGVRCPIETIMERRRASGPGRGYVVGSEDDPFPAPVVLWQESVHEMGIYDLEVDTSLLSPEECAEQIRERVCAGPGTAFPRIAGLQ